LHFVADLSALIKSSSKKFVMRSSVQHFVANFLNFFEIRDPLRGRDIKRNSSSCAGYKLHIQAWETTSSQLHSPTKHHWHKIQACSTKDKRLTDMEIEVLTGHILPRLTFYILPTTRSYEAPPIPDYRLLITDYLLSRKSKSGNPHGSQRLR